MRRRLGRLAVAALGQFGLVIVALGETCGVPGRLTVPDDPKRRQRAIERCVAKHGERHAR